MTKSKWSFWLFLFMLVVCCGGPATAQPPGLGSQENPKQSIPPIKGLESLQRFGQRAGPQVSVTAQFFTNESGSKGVLEITCNVGAGSHIYSLTQKPGGPVRSKILLAPSSQYQLAGKFQPTNKPKVTPPDLFPVPVEDHTGSVTWIAPIKIVQGVDINSLQIFGEVDGQVCTDDGACMPLKQFDTRFGAVFAGVRQLRPAPAVNQSSANQSPATPTSAAEGGAGIGGEQAAGGSTVTAPNRSPISGDLLRYLVLGFFGGMILNLMPCVLPVIGLKIMSFAQQAGESSSRILWLNICFVAGLVTVFMVLAALAAFAGWGWGAQFQRPEFAIVLALIVFVFALSFLGTWEIPIPGFVGSGKAAQAAQGEGPSGAFAKGVLTTLLATPCSGPLIVPTLAWAIPQSKPVIFAVFLAMGLGMGAPYLAIGLAPGLLKFLPKPGAWMETFKQVMGFVLLATVVWIFTFLDKDYFVPTLALLFTAWAACWWVGRVPLTGELGDKMCAYLIGSVFTAVLGYVAFSTLGPGKHWEQFSAAKLAKLRSSNTTVFVDFTADWCVSCKINEAAAVKTDRTQDFISAHGIQFLIADKTKPSPEIDALLVELGNTIKAVPFYAIFPGDGRDPIVFNDVPLLEDTLIDRLEMAVDPARNVATHNDVSASSSL